MALTTPPVAISTITIFAALSAPLPFTLPAAATVTEGATLLVLPTHTTSHTVTASAFLATAAAAR